MSVVGGESFLAVSRRAPRLAPFVECKRRLGGAAQGSRNKRVGRENPRGQNHGAGIRYRPDVMPEPAVGGQRLCREMGHRISLDHSP